MGVSFPKMESALRDLMAQKDVWEREIIDISEALSADNMGGPSGPLVDAEGFPRADIDVHATRTLRHRLAVLNTDHKALMTRIEAGLAAAIPATFTAAPTPAPPPTPAQAAAAAIPTATEALRQERVEPAVGASDADADMAIGPFAEFDEVAEGGPAHAAGALVGDLILRFGSIHAGNHDELRALVRLTQRSVGETIPLLVARGTPKGPRTTLQLQPRRWSGAGFLGCHLKTL